MFLNEVEVGSSVCLCSLMDSAVSCARPSLSKTTQSGILCVTGACRGNLLMVTAGPESLGLYVEVCVCIYVYVCVCLHVCVCMRVC